MYTNPMTKYTKISCKFERKYGYSLAELAKKLNVSGPTLCKWEQSGFDIFDKAELLSISRSDKRITHCWNNMKSRCGNPNDIKYAYYGGKGIKVKMSKLELARIWVRDNAKDLNKPSIDRINSDGHYEVSNCRFIEMSENVRRPYVATKDNTKLCFRCTHVWVPRKKDFRMCPKCKSVWWDTVKESKSK